jgi:hypothetical protein
MGLDPLHDPRKVSPLARHDEQVYMGRHDANVGEPETKLCLCVLKNKQHDFSSHIALKDPLFVIGSGRNMIRRPFNEFPFFPHNIASAYTGNGAKLPICFTKTVSVTFFGGSGNICQLQRNREAHRSVGL